MSERLTVEQERLLVRAIRDRAGLSPAERDEALGLALRELVAVRAHMAELEAAQRGSIDTRSFRYVTCKTCVGSGTLHHSWYSISCPACGGSGREREYN